MSALSSQWSVRSGSIPGTKHRRLRTNNQDALAFEWYTVAEREYGIGVVSDGCSGNKKRTRNEVGSILLSQFVLAETKLLLAGEVPMTDLPSTLYTRCVNFVGSIARATCARSAEISQFIEQHLLATVIPFVLTEDDLLVMESGDGVIAVDNTIQVIDQNDTPLYLAYHQIDRGALRSSSALPSSFGVQRFSNVSRFLISTDGCIPRKDMTHDEIASVIEPFWSYESAAPAGLQWWLNKTIEGTQPFHDDCTVIAARLR